ncbi:hypothetical protein BD769DRAFT_1387010 [Suillus cothurnatus]|nr:hypothetical protein BD769DRAFT_1387010 [Suillus cothurnatus]
MYGDVAFKPAFPSWKVEAIQSMDMIAIYADKERGRYPIWQSLDHIKLFPGSGLISVTVTEVMEVLRAIYPNTAIPDPVAFHFKRWNADPLFRGSYSNWPLSFLLGHSDLRATYRFRAPSVINLADCVMASLAASMMPHLPDVSSSIGYCRAPTIRQIENISSNLSPLSSAHSSPTNMDFTKLTCPSGALDTRNNTSSARIVKKTTGKGDAADSDIGSADGTGCLVILVGATGPLEPAPIKSAGQYHNFRGPSGDDYCTPASNLKHTDSSDISSIAITPVAQTTCADGLTATPHIQVTQQETRSNSPSQSFLEADATQPFGSSDIVEEGYDYLPDSFFQSLFVARRPERDKAKRLPPQKVSSQTQTLSQSSQNQPAVTSTSATAPIPGTSTTTSSVETAQSRPIPFWARVVLFLCCVVPAPIS